MSSIFRIRSNLYWWIYYSSTLIKNWTKAFRNQIVLLLHFIPKITFFTCSYLFSFAKPHFVVTCCYSLPFVVSCCTTRCHSLSLDAPLLSLFMNDLPMLWCECFLQVFIVKIKRDFPLNFLKVFQLLPLFLSYF